MVDNNNDIELLSEDEVRKMLNISFTENTIYPIEVTKTMKRKDLLFFLTIGRDINLKIDENISDDELIKIVKSINVDELKIPNEMGTDNHFLTKEKYRIILEGILEKYNEDKEIVLDDILCELGYEHLGGAISFE